MAKIINLFGGPGAGKSTTRAGVFNLMKLQAISVEEVTEVAKTLTWEERSIALLCQPYVFGKQLIQMERLVEKVDYIVTDSPLLLSYYYGKVYAGGRYPESFYEGIIDIFNSFKNINFYIHRVKPYHQAGRNQTEGESNVISNAILDLLNNLNVQYDEVSGDGNAASTIMKYVIGDK